MLIIFFIDEVWFDVEIKNFEGAGQHYNGRFVIGVMGETAPMTALNFVSLARGHKKGKDVLTYKDSPIHRIVPDFVVQVNIFLKPLFFSKAHFISGTYIIFNS